MKLEPTKSVRIEVVHSECDVMKKGDVVYLRGPVIAMERSGPVCVTALLAIYPWIMSSRFGVQSKHLGWDNGYKVCCPDKLVDFVVTFLDPQEKEPTPAGCL